MCIDLSWSASSRLSGARGFAALDGCLYFVSQVPRFNGVKHGEFATGLAL
jgi:hypothetical protein